MSHRYTGSSAMKTDPGTLRGRIVDGITAAERFIEQTLRDPYVLLWFRFDTSRSWHCLQDETGRDKLVSGKILFSTHSAADQVG